MLALHHTRFLWGLAVVAVAEPLLLSSGDPDMRSFALVVLGVQAVGAVWALGSAVWARG
jgi:hypothetical protein